MKTELSQSTTECAGALPLIAEIRMFGFGFAPAGWDPCDGRELRVLEHQPLFTMLGWRFGGDGWTTFALPDLRADGSADVVLAIAVTGVIAYPEPAHD